MMDDDDDRVTASVGTAFGIRLSPLRPQSQIRLRWEDRTGPHETTVGERATIGVKHATAESTPALAAGEFVGIADDTVSRLHAEISWRPSGAWLRDLDSHNGTFIEALRIESAQLYDGARIRVGETTIVIENANGAQVALWPEPSFGSLIGQSSTMREMFMRLARVADSDAAVLIHGETGTGKELVARAIHDASVRAPHPFVVVDCGTLSETLLETELFGHVRGAFTGADRARTGAIEAADGGTVFLDEIGEMPLPMQPKLLRVLESRQVRRVGDTSYRSVNVRFLSATLRDLRTMVNSGTFREDLYFRLATLGVTVPPLRERREDIPLLAQHFLHKPLDPGLEAQLLERRWPGNVRELRNALEHSRVFGTLEDAKIDRAKLTPRASGETGLPSIDALREMPLTAARNAILEAFEHAYIEGLVARYGRNPTEIAAHAKVDKSMIYRLLRRHMR